MKNLRWFVVTIFATSLILALPSCDKEPEGCDSSCATGQIQTIDCNCLTDPNSIIPHPCPTLTCPEGQVVGVMGNTCACVLPSSDLCGGMTCPAGEVLDPDKCECVRVQSQEVANPEGDALLATAYARWLASMFNNQGHAHAPQTVCADLSLIPTRGTDWFDDGKWIATNGHEWTPDHKHVQEAWNDWLSGMTEGLAALESYETKPFPVRDKQAQAKALVAFSAYNMLDLFNQVPYDRNNDGNYELLTGIEAFDTIYQLFIEAEEDLLLSTSGDANIFTKAAAWAMLGKMHLNKAVFADRYGTPNFASEDMSAANDYFTRIIESGNYALESDYFRLFDADNGFNSEFILAVQQFNDTEDRSFGRNDLAGNQLERNQRSAPAVRGSNGGCISPEFYNSWETTDPRFFERHIPDAEGVMAPEDYTDLNRGILVGPQFGPVLTAEGDAFQVDANGNFLIQSLVHNRDESLPINFTIEVPDVTGGGDGLLNQGARISKYQLDPKGGRSVGGFDIPLIRLADIYLLRAETVLRGANGDAAVDVNEVRTARIGQMESGTETLAALGSVDLDALLKERAFELYWEPHRRSDVVRFGKWEDAWVGKTDSDPNKRLFPIYAPALSDFSSIGLMQNPGY